MATIASRLANTGTLLVNGIFDEVTYTGDSTFASRTTANTIYTTGFFDEVSFNSTSPTIYNLLTYTQSINTTNWSNNLNTVTPTATLAPDNTNTASRIQWVANGYTAKQNLNVTNGATYTFSFWVKSYDGSTGTWGVNWYSGTHHRTTVPITGEWVRQSITFTADNSVINIYISDNRSSLATINDAYVWGAQLEVASSPTTYQGIAAANTLTNTSARKITSSGNYYIQEQFDEFTGAPVIDSSLKLWLDAAQTPSYNGSGSTWTDLSPSASNITLYGSPTYSDSVNGGRLQFVPASTQYGLSTANLGNMPKWTVEAWVRVTASLTGQVTSVVTNQYDLSTSLNYSIGTNNSPTNYNLCVGFFDGSWHNTLGVSPTLNTWFHIVGTYDGSTLTQYNNGSVTGSTLSYSGTPSSGGVTRIARRWDDTTASTNLFPGDISVVRIYNRALTADEVSQNFNALRNRYGI